MKFIFVEHNRLIINSSALADYISLINHMTFPEFQNSLLQNQPPENFSDLLKALWYDGKNDWETAHDFAQKQESPDYCLIHAYLHRKEGDTWNAGYWYKKAKQEMPTYSLEEEWERLITKFL